MRYALFTTPGGGTMRDSGMVSMGVEQVSSLIRDRLTYRIGGKLHWTHAVHVQGLFETEDQAYAARLAAKRAFDDALENLGDHLGDAKRAIKASLGYSNPRDPQNSPPPTRSR